MAPLTWFVTGCTSGFGKHICTELASRGDYVIATARNIERISSHIRQHQNIRCLQLDVNVSKDEIANIVQKAIDFFGQIDVLVNNAGYPLVGPFEDIDERLVHEYMTTAFFGPLNLVNAILPHFRSRRSGTLLYNSSMYSYVPGAPLATYYASAKHALAGFARTLDLEVSQFGIKTLIIDSGYFRSKFLQRVNLDELRQTEIEDYRDWLDTTVTAVTPLVGNEPGDLDKIAKVTVDLVKGEGVAKGRQVPLRVPLGPDAYQLIKQEVDLMQSTLTEWETTINSTAFIA